ncbi:MAG: hypothetical protein IJG15_02925 [Lachnospiraceae bacterium]|jgi:hypothetical protein|nr:hypothetical protein [Lachnospiraceae bacterium]
MSQFERKFGKYAVSKLSMKLVILYVIGYVLYYIQPGVFSLLTLNVAAVLHGQVWRVLSWLLVPPDPGSNLFFVAIMLYFYYSIGTSLERVWGDYKYNVYVFLGILLTILSAFAWYAFLALRGLSGLELAQMATYSSALFSTYYINMCIFLAFALTFPDAQVYLFFVLPLKVKILGWIDVGFLLLSFWSGSSAERFVIGAALLNVLLLYLRSRNWMSYSPGQVRRRQQFRKSVTEGKKAAPGRDSLHRCAICGRTEKDGDDLEFRYCSKCEGGLEYCQDHLFIHTHVKKGENPHMRKV